MEGDEDIHLLGLNKDTVNDQNIRNHERLSNATSEEKSRKATKQFVVDGRRKCWEDRHMLYIEQT